MLKRWKISAHVVIISCSAIALPGQAQLTAKLKEKQLQL